MYKSKSLSTSVHPASQNELDVLKTYRNTQCPTGGASVSYTLRAETPKYATMPFSGAEVRSEWITVAGAHPAAVFLYVPDTEETMSAFAARLSAACKLPVLKVSCAAVAEERSQKAVDSIVSVFKALRKTSIPASQIVLVGRGNGAMLALSALLRLADTDEPLPRCAIAVSPIFDAELASDSVQANEANSSISRLGETCPLLVIATDDEAAKDHGDRFAERATSAGVETTLSLYAGMPRDFALFDLPSSRDSFREIQEFVSRRSPSGPSVQVAGPLTIQRVGWAGYVIVSESGTKVLIDPYLSGSEGFHTGLPQSTIQPKDLFDVDVVAVTHAGFDHRGQSLEIVQGGNAILVCGPALYAEAIEQHVPANRMAPMVSGFEVHFKDVTIKAVPARHESTMELSGKFRSDEPLSFMVTTAAGSRIFCGGDSSISEDFKTWGSLYSPDIAVLGIGGLWVGPIDAVELPPREALLAASWLGVKTVIPVHYAPGDPAPLQLRAEVESAALPINVVILDFGQTWTRPREISDARRAA
jgi:L-ascorbate metabolism protein UlaG (beta-lactamase superfamily)